MLLTFLLLANKLILQKLLKTSANPKAAKKKKKAAEKAVTEETGAVPTLVAGQ